MRSSSALAAVTLMAALSLARAAAPSAESIRALIADGRYDQAVSAARDRVAEAPNDTEARVLLSSALFGKARAAARPASGSGAPGSIALADAEAIAKELEAAIKTAPERKDLYLGLVDVWAAAGRDDDMIKQMQRSAAQFPGDIKMMNGLLDYGLERRTRGDPLAGKILEIVQTAYPHATPAIMARASFLLNSGDLDQSVQILQTAVAAGGDPDLTEALGDAYVYKLNFEAATRAYSALASQDAKRKSPRLKWAVLLHRTDPKSARAIVEPLRAEEKGGPPTLELGKDGAAKITNRIGRAATALVRALEQPTFSANDAYGLARTFWQVGLASPAIVETDIALAKDANHVDALMLRAEIFGHAGLDAQALEALDRADATSGAAKDRVFAYSHDEILAQRAATLGRMNRTEDALKAYKSTSTPAAYAYPMALLAERLGHIDEARGLLEQVAASGTKPAEVEAAKARLAQDPYRKKP